MWLCMKVCTSFALLCQHMLCIDSEDGSAGTTAHIVLGIVLHASVPTNQKGHENILFAVYQVCSLLNHY